MYAFPEMIDMAHQKWKSEIHKRVATLLLIGNPRIFTRQQLVDCGSALNALNNEEVKALTIESALRLGIPVN